MAKGQMRTSKEAKKPKTADKKTVPKYMTQARPRVDGEARWRQGSKK